MTTAKKDRSWSDLAGHDTRGMIDQYIDRVFSVASVTAVYVSGSFARGVADAWSDIDLLATCDGPRPLGEIVDDVVLAVSDGSEQLMTFRRDGDHFTVVNLIFAPWVRVDVSVTDNQDPGGPRMTLKKVRGPGSVDIDWHAQSSVTLVLKGEGGVDRESAQRLVDEVVRLVGLLPTVLGRGDLVAGTSGCHLLWGQLVDLCLMSMEGVEKSGALSQNKFLQKEHRSLLESLPAVQPTHDSIVTFHEAAWRALVTILSGAEYRGVELPSPQVLRALTSWAGERVGMELDDPQPQFG